MRINKEGAMKAADVMVTKVITVSPESRVEDVADVMLRNRISAVPVVRKDGKIVGIVSEGDLMRRAEAETVSHRPWWLAFAAGQRALANEYIKAHSRKVTDVMTRDVVTAAPEMPLQELAALLERRRIKRVPIVKDRKLVGIVSRANLLQALASRHKTIDVGAPNDRAIRNRILAQLKGASWAHPSSINVIVHNGAVTLWGAVESPAEKKAVQTAAEAATGVRSVNNHLAIRPGYRAAGLRIVKWIAGGGRAPRPARRSRTRL
jgi:CBS domain-containing protein